jgi:SAM-dependent methyltransferase
VDWGVGEYEHAARELESAAVRVVEIAAVRPGESVLDVGCGNGNAALAAARAGGLVTGIDPAERLVAVAGERARQLGLEATFLVGDAQALEFADGAFDAVISVFAVIFAPDGEQAVSELVRVTRPGGRIAISCWFGSRALSEAIAVAQRHLAAAGIAPSPHPGAIDWSDQAVVRAAFERSGAAVTVTEHEQHFTGPSPESYWDDLGAHHPLAITARAALERAGTYDLARSEAIAVLENGNESANGFQVTSQYFVLRAEKLSD